MKTPDHSSLPELDPQLESAVWAVVSERLPGNVAHQVAARAKELQHEPVTSDESAVELTSANVNLTSGDGQNPQGADGPTRKINRRRLLQGLSVGVLAAGLAFTAVGPLGIFAPRSLYAQAMENLKHGGIYYELSFVGAEVRPPSSAYQWGSSSKYWVANDGRSRIEDEGGSVSIHDKFGNMLLMLNPSDKIAMVSTTAPSKQRPKFIEGWIGIAHDSCDAEEVERELKDGKELVHFKVDSDDPNLTFDVWVDTGSKSINRVEFSDTRIKPWTDERGITFVPPTKTIISNIKTGQDFDEALFSTTPPEGYVVHRGPLQ